MSDGGSFPSTTTNNRRKRRSGVRALPDAIQYGVRGSGNNGAARTEEWIEELREHTRYYILHSFAVTIPLPGVQRVASADMECRHGRLRGDRLPVAANPLWPHDYPCGCYPGETPQIGSSPSKNGNGRLTDNTKALARLREGLAEAGIELDEGAPAPANGKLNGSGARGPHSRTLRDPSLG